MNKREAEQRLLDEAARHHGVFTTDQARAAGLGAGLVQHRLDTGRWQALLRGVYLASGSPSSYEQRLLAAVLFNGSGAVASHRSAARLWGLPGFGADVEVTKPRGRSQRTAYGLVHGSMHLPAAHATVRCEIPVTTVGRTVFDLAGVIHPRRVERALDNALAKRLCTVGQLEVVFVSLARRGRRGTALIRELLEARGEGYVAPTSELEALGRAVLRDGGLPEPVAELNLGDDVEWFGRVDLVYREARIVIELDSRRHHTAMLDQMADRRRDNRFGSTGWRVLRYTWWDLVERPAEVVAEIKRALAARAA